MTNFSLVVPVYKNEPNIPALLAALEEMSLRLRGELEVVFVVDGSPDRSYVLLRERLQVCGFRSVLIALSRNFGSFSAILMGLSAAKGPFFAVMAADLQEPPELVVEFFESLARDEADVAIGTRLSRGGDPFITRITSGTYWWIYRRFVQPEMPPGGVDVFGCNDKVRRVLLQLEETNSSLVGLLFWVGFRRKYVPYSRRKRQDGKSGWTLKRKLRYMSDSMYAFSDLPIRLMVLLGFIGVIVAFVSALVIFGAWATGRIEVEGYTPIMMSIFFFAAFFLFAMGVLGSYVYRAFENTKRRPNFVEMSRETFGGEGPRS